MLISADTPNANKSLVDEHRPRDRKRDSVSSYGSEFDCVKSVTSSVSTLKNQATCRAFTRFKSDDIFSEEVKSCGGDSTCSEIDSIKTEEFSDVFNHYSNLTGIFLFLMLV